MDRASQQQSRTAWTAAWIYFACVMLAYSCVILLASDPPPFVDYPDWAYQGHLFHEVLTGHAVPGYALKHYPIPNSTTTVGLGLLELLLPWRWAAKVWMVVYLALASCTSWALLRALRLREWRLVAALPAILFLNLDFWYGHINFELGLSLLLLLLALLVRKASSIWLAFVLILLFFTHMEACAGALLLLGIWCATTRDGRRLWAAAPTVALVAWYIVGRYSYGNSDAHGMPEAVYRDGWQNLLIYKANTVVKIFGYVHVVDRQQLSITEQILGRGPMLLLIAVSLVVATLCVVQIVRACAQKTVDTTRLALQRFCIVLLALAALLPHMWLGVFDPGSRLLLTAAAASLLIIDWTGWRGASIAAMSSLLCVVNLWQLARVERDPWMAGHTRDLPYALQQFGHIMPATRLDDYDAIDHGPKHILIFPTALFVDLDPPSGNTGLPPEAPHGRE